MYLDSLFSGFTSADATDRMNQAVDNELTRQYAYMDYGTRTLGNAIQDNSTSSADQTLSQGKDQALSAYRKVESTPYVTGGKQYSGEEAFSTKANTKSYTNRTNEAKAANQAYTNLGTAETVSALDTGTKLKLNAAESSASASPLSAEVSQAEESAYNTWLAEAGQVSSGLYGGSTYQSYMSAASGSGSGSSSSGSSGMYSNSSSDYSLGGSPSYTGGTSTGGSD